ncbi:hypothetical protein [Natrinema sp. 1APR25-10V2]|uniref:hypothetical protein n=1 Tax=Natrinema sp. 1APR25-10V2 TaxID=2951081 RepID=UPI00287455DD|nr:hypothetical protein [Natrinema sp. 1APR25-10V2]MDS0474364.1 hypothetical protein [Natrinema sp. 1APR25-10V2]
MKSQIPFQQLSETANADDINFIAIPKGQLVDGKMLLLYHSWRGYSPLKEDIPKVDYVTLDGKEYPTMWTDVYHTNVHFCHRIPIYSTGILGTPEISFEEGIENVRKFLTKERKPTQESTETTTLQSLLEELVEAGANLIGVDKVPSQCTDFNFLLFRTRLEPGIGVPIFAQYSGVVLDGQTYTIDCICDAVNRPPIRRWVILFASDTLLGMEPVSIETGQENLRDFLSMREDQDVGTNN